MWSSGVDPFLDDEPASKLFKQLFAIMDVFLFNQLMLTKDFRDFSKCDLRTHYI